MTIDKVMNNLDKILDLVRKTGDKVIVAPDFGEPYVVIPLDQYESMIRDEVDYSSMDEEDILNRVNREISLWKQAQRDLGWDAPIDFMTPKDLERELPFEEEEDFELPKFEDHKIPEVEAPWEKPKLDKKIDELDWDEEDWDDDRLKSAKGDHAVSWEEEDEDWDDDWQEDELEDFKIEEEKEESPVKYEDIPPPPSVEPQADFLKNEEKPVIDMSYTDEVQISSEDDSEKDEDEFLVEPV